MLSFLLFQSINISHAANYFLDEIQRLENAGADFVYSERMCRLKYLNDLFEFEEYVNEEEKITIQKTIDEIDHNNVGNFLISMLGNFLHRYPKNLVSELIEKKCIKKEEELEILNKLKEYNLEKIYISNDNKTTFQIPKPIRMNYIYSWNLEDNKKNFMLKLFIENLEDKKISVLFSNSFDSVMDKITKFYNVLAHELIHAADFLNNPHQYRQNNLSKDGKDFERSITFLWPSLCEENDGFKIASVWDYRLTELIDVVGYEEGEDHGSIGISEMSFTIKNYIRFPYANKKTTVSQRTLEIIFNSGRTHLNNLSLN